MFVGAQPTNSSCIIERGHRRSVLGIIVVASLLSGFLSSVPASAQTLEQWRDELSQIPQPKKGCFTAAYPSKVWQEIACTTPPAYPQTPRNGPQPLTIGNGNNVLAEVSGSISSATGSFDSVTGVATVSSPIANTAPPVADAYTLQLNTNFFNSRLCLNSPSGPFVCQGWQQFVFENNGSPAARAYIQFWLIEYNTTCPPGEGWNQFQFTGSMHTHCWKNNSMGAVPVPAQPIANLAQLSVTATSGGGHSSIIVSTGSNVYSVSDDDPLEIGSGGPLARWQQAEFNVFGDGGNSDGGSQASFNSGSITIVTRTKIIWNSPGVKPGCLVGGYTGETNNLGFGPAPNPPQPGPAPALISLNKSAGVSANCALATSVGDTHLTTFGGLLYDFQATGDFLLAETEDFLVQTRQVSVAPTWPDASANKAVAVRTGKSRVTICAAPTRVEIDGRPAKLLEGKSLELRGGGDLVRRGNDYVVRGSKGDSMRAVVNGDYIDVWVGLGRWPTKIRGLLANAASGKVNDIEARDGTVLTSPFSFAALYGRYADSWRVASNESMLSACAKTKSSTPKKPFFASDLNPKVSERTRAVCTGAGVKEGALLDACALDVAVIGRETAAKVFVGVPAPTAVGDRQR